MRETNAPKRGVFGSQTENCMLLCIKRENIRAHLQNQRLLILIKICGERFARKAVINLIIIIPEGGYI